MFTYFLIYFLAVWSVLQSFIAPNANFQVYSSPTTKSSTISNQQSLLQHLQLHLHQQKHNLFSIPCQINDILGQKDGFLALCPGRTSPLSKKQKFLRYDFLTKISKKNFSPFYFASPKIIEVKFCNRQTDTQGYVDFFFRLNLLPPYSLG